MTKERMVNRIIGAGLKNTKYRVNIIEMLSKTDELVSAQEIYNRLLKKSIFINLSTVYRTLDILVDNKILNRVTIEGEKQSFYEYNRDIHHHFLICRGCNKIIPIYDCPLEDYEQKLKSESGFVITGHRVEFYGYCDECRKNLI